MILTLGLLPAQIPAVEAAQTSVGTVSNPINGAVSAPDPEVRYYNGYYYGLWTEGSAVILHRSRSLSDLPTGERRVLYDGSGEIYTSIWCPELVRDTKSGKWYVYADGVARGDDNNISAHRIFCLEGDALWGDYTFKGVILDDVGVTNASVYHSQNLKQPYLSYTKGGRIYVCRMDSYTCARSANAVQLTATGEASVSGGDLFEYGKGYSSTLYMAYTCGSQIKLLKFAGNFRSDALNADALWVDDGTLISSENNQAPSLFVDPKGDLYAAFHILGLTAGYNQWHRPMGVAQVGSDGSVWKDVIRPDTVSMVELAPNDGITDLSCYKSVYRGTNAQEAAELLGMTTESYSGQSGKIILVDSENPPANGNIRIAFEGETIRICASSDKIVDTVRYFMQEYLDDIHFTEADSFEGDLIVNPTNGIDAPDAYVQYVDGWYYGMWTTGKDNLWLYRSRTLSGLTVSPYRKQIMATRGEAPLQARVWAPEFYFDDTVGNPTSGKWIIYATGSKSADYSISESNIGCFVSSTADLWNSTYSYVGNLFSGDPQLLDATFFKQGDQLYIAYSQVARNLDGLTDGTGKAVDTGAGQYTMIAKMKNYTTVDASTIRVLRCCDVAWEMLGNESRLNEGPEFLEVNDRLYLCYSAHGATSQNYTLGLMRFSGDYKIDDLTDASKWVKLEEPFLTKNDTLCATGHNSFFQDENGDTWIAVHAKTYDDTSKWGVRMVSFQPVELDSDGNPKMNNVIRTYAVHKQSGYTTEADDWVNNDRKAYSINGREFTYSADIDVYALKPTAQLTFAFGTASSRSGDRNRFILESSRDSNAPNQFVLGGACNGSYSWDSTVFDTTTCGTLHVSVHYKDGSAEIDVNGVTRSYTGLDECVNFLVSFEKVNATVRNIQLHIENEPTGQKTNRLDGIYTIRPQNAELSGQDVRVLATAAAGNSTSVKLYDADNAEDFHFILEYNADDDSYCIRSESTGLYLHAYPNRWTVAMQEKDGSDAQRWYPVMHNDGSSTQITWHFVNKENGYNLDLSNGSATDGSSVGSWPIERGSSTSHINIAAPNLWAAARVTPESAPGCPTLLADPTYPGLIAGPISKTNAADPDVVYYNGYYYGTWSAGNRIILARSRTLAALRDSGETRVVYNGAQGAEGDVRYAIWGPDIVHDPVGDRWYIYASGSTVSGVSNYQNYQTLFCIESDTAALWGDYHYAATLMPPADGASGAGKKDPGVYYVQELKNSYTPTYDGSEVTAYSGTPFMAFNYQNSIWICPMNTFTSMDISKAVKIKSASERWENGRNCGGPEFFEYDGKLYLAYTSGSGSSSATNYIGLLLFDGGANNAFRRTALDDASRWSMALSTPLVTENGCAQPSVFCDGAANLWMAFHETMRSDNLRPLWAVRIAVNDGSDISAVSRDTVVSMTDITPAEDHITDFNGWSVVYNHESGASAAQTLADGLKTYCMPNGTVSVTQGSSAENKTIFLDTVNYPASYVRGDVSIDFDAANQTVTLFASFENAAGLAGYFVSNFLATDNINYSDADDYYGDLIANPTNPSVSAADPCVRYYNGYYYGMWTKGNSLWLYRSENLSALSNSSQRKKIYQVPEDELTAMGVTDASTWAPEFVFDDDSGCWYIYFSRKRPVTYDDASTGYKYQLCYMVSSGSDLWNSTYTFGGYLFDWKQEDFCVDPTILTFKDNNGTRQIFLMYNQKTSINSSYVDPITGNRLKVENYLSLVKMKNYGEADFSTRVLLFSGGDFAWENEVDGSNSRLNEGPHFLQLGDRLFCAYSANAYTDTRYLLGFLEFKPGVSGCMANPGSLLDKSNWTKLSEPYLSTGNGINGPGHNSFFTDEYGDLWIAYHGRSGENLGSFRPLCFQRVELDQYGAPALNAKPETYQTETKRNTYTTDITRWVTKALTGTYVGGNSFTYSADVDVYAANRTAQIMLGYHLDTGDSLIWNERCVLQLTANDASYDNLPWFNLYNISSGWHYVPGGISQPPANHTLHLEAVYDAAVNEITVTVTGEHTASFTQKLSQPITDFTVGTEKLNAVFHNVQLRIDDPTQRKFAQSPAISDGIYALTSAKDETYCAAMDSGLKLKQFKNAANTRFAFTRNADGTYFIRNLSTNQYLTVNRNGSYSVFGAAMQSGEAQLLQKWVVTLQADGSYSIVNAATDKALDVSNATIAENQGIGEWQFIDNSKHQLWKLQPLDSLIDGVYTVTAADGRVWDGSSNLTLKAADGTRQQQYLIRHTTDGSYIICPVDTGNYLSYYPQDPPAAGNVLNRVGQYAEDPLTHINDQWYVIPNDDGSYSFVSCKDGKYVGISGDQLQAQETNFEASQKWTLTAQRTLLDGVYQLGAFRDQNAVLDVAGHGTDEGANMQVLRNAHTDGQQFAIEYRGNGCYTVRDIHSNRYLDVYGGGCANDTKLAMYDEEASAVNANKLFRILPNTDGTYSLVCNVSNQYVDLDCGSTADGTKVHTWQTTLGGDTQKWWIMTEPVIAEGEYVIAAGSDPAFVMGVENNNIALAAADGSAAQKYRLRLENGDYTIQNAASGKLLNVSGNGNTDGTNLIQYTAGDTASGDSERWSIIPHYDGTVSFVSKSCGMYIDLCGNALTAGTNIYLWSSTAGANNAKKWRLLDHSHVYVLQNAVEATCTEAGYTGDMICSVCGDVLSKGTVTAAIGHSYTVYTNNGENHSVSCDRCGDTYTEEHTFVEGVCVCQAYEMPQELKFKYASLTLSSDISINFYVADETLEDWDAPYVVFSKAKYDTEGNITGYDTETVSSYTEKDGCHVYTFHGITSMEMSSAVTATLYATSGGTLASSKTVSYSVLTYATNQLQRSTDTKLKVLLVDLLNYGAAAQTYWTYNMANLANGNLTAEQQALATQTAPTLESCKALTPNEGATVHFSSATLSLKEKVMINYYLDLMYYTGDVNDLQVKISYEETDGVVRTACIDGSKFVYRSGYYCANFSELNAMQMRTLCAAEVYSKATGSRVSDTVIYSIESYAESKANDADAALVELVTAMMKYGDSTCAYFGK